MGEITIEGGESSSFGVVGGGSGSMSGEIAGPEVWYFDKTTVSGIVGTYTASFVYEETSGVDVACYALMFQTIGEPPTVDMYLHYIYYSGSGSAGKTVFVNGWIDEIYRTITLEEPATGDLLTFLEANATRV